MKPKMGRPPLPKGEAKGVLIGARFSPDEAQRVVKAAANAKQGKSKWVRSVLLTATEKH
jgi:hypothetical protein